MVDAPGLDGIIHQPVRLRIMAALYKNRQLDFPSLRDGLDLTPGNLGAHLARLEECGYVASARVLAGVSFEMRYRITPLGSAAFSGYLQAVRSMLADMDTSATEPRALRGPP